MSSDTDEASRYSGAPVELFEFIMASTAWRYTSADKAFTYAGNSYTPVPMIRSAVEFSQEQLAQNLEVHLPLTDPLAAMFIADTPVARVFVTVRRFHRADPSDVIQAFPGEVISCRVEEGDAVLICAPISDALKRRVPHALY